MRRIGKFTRFTLIQEPGVSLSKVWFGEFFMLSLRTYVGHQSFCVNISLFRDSLLKLTEKLYSMPYAPWAHISFAHSCRWFGLMASVIYEREGPMRPESFSSHYWLSTYICIKSFPLHSVRRYIQYKYLKHQYEQ